MIHLTPIQTAEIRKKLMNVTDLATLRPHTTDGGGESAMKGMTTRLDLFVDDVLKILEISYHPPDCPVCFRPSPFLTMMRDNDLL